MSLNLQLGGRFRMGHKIGGGSFGEIFHGVNIVTGEQVAVKVESAKARFLQLEYEYRLYNILHSQGYALGIPRVHYFCKEGEHNALVLDLLGPSLEELFTYCNRKFSLKTVLLLAEQLLSRLEYLHSNSFIFRDIKPDNFLIGLGNDANVVHMIDFGLAKQYRNPRTLKHIPFCKNKNVTGTARYVSLNTHLGIEQSRRDDLESLGFVLMYFNRGSLPWQGVKANTKKEKYDKICEIKMATSIKALCKKFPAEFTAYLEYCRNLPFDADPNYEYLRGLFRSLYEKSFANEEPEFDWTVQAKKALVENDSVPQNMPLTAEEKARLARSSDLPDFKRRPSQLSNGGRAGRPIVIPIPPASSQNPVLTSGRPGYPPRVVATQNANRAAVQGGPSTTVKGPPEQSKPAAEISVSLKPAKRQGLLSLFCCWRSGPPQQTNISEEKPQGVKSDTGTMGDNNTGRLAMSSTPNITPRMTSLNSMPRRNEESFTVNLEPSTSKASHTPNFSPGVVPFKSPDSQYQPASPLTSGRNYQNKSQ